MAKEFKRWNLIEALLSLLFGLLLIIFPQEMREIVCCLLGAAVILLGVMRLVIYFRTSVAAVAGYDFALGICLLAAGICVLIWRKELAVFLALLLGGTVIVRGIINWQRAVDLIRLHCADWWIAVVVGAVDVAFGIVVLCLREQGFIFMLAGAALIVSAVGQIFAAIFIGNMLKKLEQSAGLVESTADDE
ncbi:MAG: DUF308 domain-containing protein [Acutalibacteraceae bacterium]